MCVYCLQSSLCIFASSDVAMVAATYFGCRLAIKRSTDCARDAKSSLHSANTNYLQCRDKGILLFTCLFFCCTSCNYSFCVAHLTFFFLSVGCLMVVSRMIHIWRNIIIVWKICTVFHFALLASGAVVHRFPYLQFMSTFLTAFEHSARIKTFTNKSDSYKKYPRRDKHMT